MKDRNALARVGLAALLLATLHAPLSTARAQGTAFTYQGRLDLAGTPANGASDLTFTLYDADTFGNTVGTSNTMNDLLISNGLFTVTLDFGAGTFNGAARWLQIAARPGASTGAYTNLAPRQSVTPSPYAIFAGGASAAGVSGVLSAAQIPTLDAATKLTGTLPDARVSSNVPLRDAVNNFVGLSNTFSGHVGIGTTTPLAPLTVTRNASGAVGPTIRLENNAGTANDKARLEFYDVNIPRAALEWNIVGGHGGATWNFLDTFTGSPTVGTNSRLFINNGGNVGIGTTTPGALLDLRRATAVGERLRLSGNDYANNGDNASGISFVLQRNIGNRADLFIGHSPDIASNATNSGLRIIPGGNPTSPQTAGVTFLDAVSTSGTALRDLSLNGNSIRITPSGNVGIGTANPVHRFDVNFGANSGVAGFGDIHGSGPLMYLGTTAGSTVNLMSRNSHDITFIAFPGEVGTELLRVKANGNVGIGTTNPATKLDVAGEVTCVAVNITSDRNAKEDFKPVSARDVLQKVTSLAITEWQYKEQPGVRHIGPVAQDFHSAFGVGRDEKHITTVDADGVALAAIQGLNEVVREKETRIKALEERLEQLEKLVREGR